ncbi:hypothetical protein [Mycobacteroides abscessus]
MDYDKIKITPTGDDNGDTVFFSYHARMIDGVWCRGGHLVEQQMIADIEAFLADQ